MTPPEMHPEITLVGVDDGSPTGEARDKAELACIDNGAEFIQHESNRGIPAAWNSLARFCEADIVVLLNDDIQVGGKLHDSTTNEDVFIGSHRWLEAAVYMLENNPDIGVVGWPTSNREPTTGAEYYSQVSDGPPGFCGAPVGCCFAFRQKDFEAVGGFWEELISFYEEIDFGFMMYEKLRMRNCMLPWPPMIHWHSQTFAKNPELNRIEVGPDDPVFEDLVRLIGASAGSETRLRVGRMDRSRVMFAKKWGCEDLRHAPQNELHEKYLAQLEAIELKWLSKDGPKSEMVK